MEGFLAAFSVASTDKVKDAFSNLQEEDPCLKEIRLGQFGTLDDIFDFYDLQKEFREAYPTDESFWNVPADWTGSAPTFERVLKGLMEKKEKRV